MSIGDWRWIAEYAQQRGITIPQLAAILGVASETVRTWIRGRNDPGFMQLLALTQLFCNGSIEAMAQLAGIDWKALSETLTFQMDVLGIEHDTSTRQPVASTLLLPLPIVAFQTKSTLSEQARDVFIQAADLMIYTSRFQELYAQIDLLRRTNGQDAPFVARLCFEAAYAQLMLGDYPGALAEIERARELSFLEDEQAQLANTHWLSAEILRIIGDLQEARRHCEAATKIYRQVKVQPTFREPGPVWVVWNQSCIDSAYGRYSAAASHLHQLGVMASTIQLTEAKITTLWGHAYIAEMKGEFNKAQTGYNRARRLANDSGNRFWEAESLWRIAEVKRKTGHFSSALATAQKAQAMYASIGNQSMVAKLSLTIAACHLQSGAIDDALVLYPTLIDFFEQNHDQPMEQAARSSLALTRLAKEMQKPEPAYEEILQALPAKEPFKWPTYSLSLEIYRGLAYSEALRLAGYLEKAFEHYYALAEVAASYGHRLERAHALLGVAETKRMLGQQAKIYAHEALAIYRNVGSVWGQVHALITLALTEQVDGPDSLPFLQEAAAIARKEFLKPETRLIEALTNEIPVQNNPHILLFV